MKKWYCELWRYVNIYIRSFAYFTTKGGTKPCSSSRVLVSLSTIPDRIAHIEPTLKSLLDQTVRPEAIYLAVPLFSIRENKSYDLPEALRAHPFVTVLRPDRDLGPITKIIPALLKERDHPDTLILAVDDDNIYPSTFIETFLTYSLRYPEAAFSLRGWVMPESYRWKDSIAIKGTALRDLRRVDVLNGCAGILVKPKFFQDDFFYDERKPPGVFFCDDIWISGHLAKQHVPKFILPFRGLFVYLPSLSTFGTRRLDRDENLTGFHNDQAIQYFRPYWRTDILPDSDQ